jgi:RimJ/RimL family protein N-acetyltransferase
MTVLHTERLILRPIEDSDLDPLYEIQGDRDHMRLTFWAESRAACEGWLRRYESLREVNGFAPWTTVNREDGRVIGWGGLNTDPSAPGWGVEVSYFIHPSYEGRGFATEIVGASLRHGFAEHALQEICAFAMPENHGSIRVLDKCGFGFLRFEPALARITTRFAARTGVMLALPKAGRRGNSEQYLPSPSSRRSRPGRPGRPAGMPRFRLRPDSRASAGRGRARDGVEGIVRCFEPPAGADRMDDDVRLALRAQPRRSLFALYLPVVLL